MYPLPIQKLINAFNRLPGIGMKTSERFVFYLLKRPKSEIAEMINALAEAGNKIKYCRTCQNFSEKDICPICSNEQRDRSLICVTALPQNVEVLENTGAFKGLYHVLHGTINTLEGAGPHNLKVKELIERVSSGKNGLKEIIFAFNPDVEGETTALYLMKMLKPYNIKMTRLARGIPMGGDIEYADEITLGDALKGRRNVE